MSVPINNSFLRKILVIALTNFFCFSININQAVSAGGETPQPTTSGNSGGASPTVQNAGALSVTPTTLLQTGSNNYANLNPNTGALNYPFCSGTCGFAIMRTTPSTYVNGKESNQVEGVIGLIVSFDSPDKTNAESNRQIVEIQQQRSENEIASIYIKAIADACQTKDLIRAELSAKALARIWAVEYVSLLSHNCR